MYTTAPPPGDYTYNNYGFGNQNNGFGSPPGGPPAYSSSWNNTPNLFSSGSFGSSPYGAPSPYGNSPSIFTQTPPGYGSQYPGQGEFGSFNVGYPNQDYGQGQGQGNYGPGSGNYGPAPGGYGPAPTPGDYGPAPTPGNYGPAPTPGDTTPPPPAGSPPAGTPPASGGSGSDYVDMMMTALKNNGAGPELLDAYMKQYVALGMVPAGTAVPSGGPTPTPAGGPTPAVGPTPTPAGGPTPVPTPSGQGGAESQEFANIKPINWDKAPPQLQALKPQIEAAAKATGMPDVIIASVIWNESRGNINVQATNGAAGVGSDQGLMQIDNTTYDAEVAGQNGLPHGTTPTDPAQNIMAGATYLSDLKQKFGTWDLALRAYNSGENGVDKSNPDATPAGTGIGPYVQYARQHVTDLENGTLNPNG